MGRVRHPTLVVSAFEPEVAPLRRLLGAAPGIEVTPVGIGAVEAAAGSARAIAELRPARVVFVGTAGAYLRGRQPSLPLGAVAIAGELCLVSTASLRGDGYLPALTIVRAAASPALRDALAGLPGSIAPTVIACPLAITRARALARRIAAATGATLENLEAFAVARAAAAAGVDFAAVLGVANCVGPTAHAEWRAHHRAASAAACRFVARFFTQKAFVPKRS